MSGMIIMLLFNVAHVFTTPSSVFDLVIGGVVGFVTTVLAVGVISGFNILGSGLTGASVKILFGVASILNILFQVNISGFPIGLGLASTMMSAFSIEEFMGLGFIAVTILSVMTLVSGLMMIINGSGE